MNWPARLLRSIRKSKGKASCSMFGQILNLIFNREGRPWRSWRLTRGRAAHRELDRDELAVYARGMHGAAGNAAFEHAVRRPGVGRGDLDRAALLRREHLPTFGDLLQHRGAAAAA